MIMNLKEFTEYVDRKTEEMDQKQLQCLIHSLARKIPEGRRKEFVNILENIREDVPVAGNKQSLKSAVRKADEKEIQKEFSRLTKLFDKVEEAALFLYADGYEDYSQGYWSDNWVWEYEDPKHVCQIYEDSSRFIQRCINDGFYEEASTMFDIMAETEILVKNDWEDFYIDLKKMVDEELLALNLHNLALAALYAAYQISKPEERAQNLYVYFSIPYFKEIRLEEMLSLGTEELEGLSDFWDAWIMLLANKSGDLECRLLKEAVLYQNGEQGIIEAARLAYKEHPSLYLEAMKIAKKTHADHNQLEIGQEALEKIDKKYVLRSEIALKTAEAAFRLNKTAVAESCWIEAFLSDTTPVNYLRIINESLDWKKQRKLADSIILSAKTGDYTGSNVRQELKENIISKNYIHILQYLDGNFESAMDQCRKIKQSLGWTGSFMKCGIALFLLLLTKDDQWKPGCRRMAETILSEIQFRSEDYYKGTRNQAESVKGGIVVSDNMDTFHECFQNWKKKQHLTEAQEQNYIAQLEKFIDKRIKAIVSGQYRNHYRSVAALAAALGEVKESRGEMGGKQKTLQAYREEFPRHSSFIGELRSYGMKDVRKGRR